MLIAFIAATAIAGIAFVSDKALKPAPPKVISTFPTQGAIITPGPIKLSVTFDRPMRQRSYSFVQKSAETYPDCGTNQPVQSNNGKTFTLTCKVKAGHRYEVWFNNPPYLHFAGENGDPAVPFGLSFQTKPSANSSE
ncbi:Ig-like domain-containing protein [Sphingomonas sp. A2-49]|uniref:Ig-like domain-containing protein n=1 Tax=Sphingomonas sp. A2-49 TaxID=1391375 RepID=UPI0021CF46E1|nr:Ig-like domain-containing protein [Sphingomonas sp. A2-49]MCU6453554.1 Ig-like domain-containing protein [Sphingomonas sp. A2-49]